MSSARAATIALLILLSTVRCAYSALIRTETALHVQFRALDIHSRCPCAFSARRSRNSILLIFRLPQATQAAATSSLQHRLGERIAWMTNPCFKSQSNHDGALICVPSIWIGPSLAVDLLAQDKSLGIMHPHSPLVSM